MRRLFILIALLVLPPALCAAQDGGNAPGAGNGIMLNYFGGRVLKHSPKFTLPIPQYTQGMELSFMQQLYGRKPWQQHRHYPQWGFGTMYLHYGIDNVYGNLIAVYPHIQFPIIGGRRLSWTLRAGAGLGLVSRHFERYPVWDTANVAIGSTLNNFTIVTTDIRYTINQHWAIQAGGNFTHMSNGAFRFPNLGVNVYGAHVGIQYFPVTSQPKHIESNVQPLPSRLTTGLRLGIAFQEAGFADGPIYPVYIATGYIGLRYRGKNKVMIGIDAAEYPRIYAYERNNEFNPGHEKAGAWKGAVFAAHEWLFGRTGFLLQAGAYYHQAYLASAPVYEKLGIIYHIVQQEAGPVKDISLHFMLKAHYATAELAETGIGIGF